MSSRVQRVLVVGSMVLVFYASVSAGGTAEPEPERTRAVMERRAGSVVVTPDGGAGGSLPVDSSGQLNFTINYTDDVMFEETFDLACSGSLGIECSVQPTATVFTGAPEQVAVSFTASSQTGTATVQFSALGLNTDYFDAGTYNVTVYVPVQVIANSVPSTVTQYAEGMTATFDVVNQTGSSGTFSFDCAWGGEPEPCLDPSNTSISNNDTATVVVTFDVGGVTASQDLTLMAMKGGYSNSATESIDVVDYQTVYVTAVEQEGEVYAEPDTERTDTFVVRFPGQSATSFAMSASCPDTGTEVRDCEVEAADDTLSVGDTPVQVRVTYTAGADLDTSAVTLTATKVGDPEVTHSSDLRVIAIADVVLSVYDANPGMEVDRGACLNIAAGPGAIVCDDYQLVYPFTAVTRMNRPRQIGLIYNSALPHPQGTTGLNIVFPPGDAKPDSINVELVVADSTRGNTTYAGWHYAGGEKFRVANSWTWGVGAFEQLATYTFYVKRYDGGALVGTDSISGKSISLDKRRWFGRGWWLAGYEHVRHRTDPDLGDVLIWTGADASARVYIEPEGAPDTFVAWSRARPDTIFDLGSEYVRHLLGGGEVRYNALGYHTKTVNANADTTYFDHAVDGNYTVPVSIRVPTPSGPDTIYKLDYNNSDGRLEKVQVRSGSGGWDTFEVHATSATSTQFQIDSIVAPDARTMKFGFDGGPGEYRLDTIVDFRGTETVIDWTWNVVRSVTTTTSEDTVVLDYLAAAPVGISYWGTNEYRPRPSDSLRVVLNGPLATDADSTSFYVTGWRAVRGVRDALLNETWIDRDDVAFPALPTRVRHPNGWIVEARYNDLALFDTIIDHATGGVTTYEWDTQWSRPTRITTPEGIVTEIAYDPSTGNRDSLTVGGETVVFDYDGDGLVTGVTDPAGHETTYGYDGFGNLDSIGTALSFVTLYERDDVGRITLTTSPIDGTETATTSVDYDVMGRDTLRFSTSTQDPDEWLAVHTEYDPLTKDRIEVRSLASVPASTDTATITPSEWEYDDLGRVVVQRAVTVDSLDYDESGKLIAKRVQTGDTIRFSYDLLGRVDTTWVTSRDYSAGSGAINDFPADTFPAEITTFSFDVMGNVIAADNSMAHIRRGYTLNGFVATDTLSIKNWGNASFGHVHGLGNVYDRDGRRVALEHPSAVSAGTDRTIYVYDSSNGSLESLTDALGTRFDFTYDVEGHLIRKAYPGGRDTLSYDADHRLTGHRVDTDGVLRWSDALTYDQRDKVTVGGMTYTGLGYLEDPGNFTWGLTGEVLDFEDYVVNGLGQVTTRQGRDYFTESDFERSQFHGPDGDIYYIEQQWSETPNDPPTEWEPSHSNFSNSIGQRTFTFNQTYSWAFDENFVDATKLATYRDEAMSYYSGDGRLMAQRFHRDTVDASNVTDTLGVSSGAYDEFWYDALGRRVLKRSYQDGSVCDRTDRCHNSIERYVWDGDQLLWELRQDDTGDAAVPSASEQAGRIGYVHAAGTDAPVGMMRHGQAVVLHRNWRGTYDMATDTSGAMIHCPPNSSGSSCDLFPWPGWSPLAWVQPPLLQKTHIWFGSLALNQFDESGLAYRRNRYYDPASGQFTQQDPIGIAGGLNLYGYANGDPINYSDPFGLLPCLIPVPQVLVGCAALVAATGAAAFLASSVLSDATSKDELTRARRKPGRTAWEWVKDVGEVVGDVVGGLLGGGPSTELPELPTPPPSIEVPDLRRPPPIADSIRGGSGSG